MTKYKAKPVVKTFPDGSSIRFDSMLEMAYWEKLTLSGSNFQFHPVAHFTLEGGTVYRPDYYFPMSGVFVEVKGGRIRQRDGKKSTSESPMWKRTRKQLKERYPNLPLKIVYGRADKLRGFVTEWVEWLNEPQSE